MIKLYLILRIVIILIFIQLTSCGSIESTRSNVTYNWNCQKINADKEILQFLDGPEDIAIDYDNQMAYISSMRAGGIFQLELSSQPPKLSRLVINDNLVEGFKYENIQPHGISFFYGSDSKGTFYRRLFVINKEGNPAHDHCNHSFVDVFDINDKGLTHVKRIPDGKIKRVLNDLVAIAPDRFYATSNSAGHIASFFFGEGQIVYYDGSDYTIVYSGDLYFANGIEYQPSNKNLYVTTSGDGKLVIFKETENNPVNLAKVATFELDSSLDNIHWTNKKRDHFLISGHKNMFQFMLSSCGAYSPSNFYDVYINQYGNPSNNSIVKFELEDKDKILSAASVAAQFNKNIVLIGSVNQKETLAYCKRK